LKVEHSSDMGRLDVGEEGRGVQLVFWALARCLNARSAATPSEVGCADQ
jgi:hypothetical protein